MSRLTLALAALLAAVPAYASTPVNINTADATALAHALDGVGLSKAKAIVAWREANGDFESADQLADVKGIGPSLVERNRDAILLGDDKPAKKKTTTKARHAEAE
ncbi:MAG: hypothetical protein GAK28_00010 [Luteibacter sp.]|uniref:ComEA family DNA-binding protein n=1 Tax=Luteibacter sp. TaxID=1886636 RepID=UPI00137DA1DF|nr:helix-hairpin-helix domain-containing protein [Luteibacter sp.]KAF1009373.1 MAG: hypothetical protein GAK28_00010 [Luteibacter sp.]